MFKLLGFIAFIVVVIALVAGNVLLEAGLLMLALGIVWHVTGLLAPIGFWASCAILAAFWIIVGLIRGAVAI